MFGKIDLERNEPSSMVPAGARCLQQPASHCMGLSDRSDRRLANVVQEEKEHIWGKLVANIKEITARTRLGICLFGLFWESSHPIKQIVWSSCLICWWCCASASGALDRRTGCAWCYMQDECVSDVFRRTFANACTCACKPCNNLVLICFPWTFEWFYRSHVLFRLVQRKGLFQTQQQ